MRTQVSHLRKLIWRICQQTCVKWLARSCARSVQPPGPGLGLFHKARPVGPTLVRSSRSPFPKTSSARLRGRALLLQTLTVKRAMNNTFLRRAHCQSPLLSVFAIAAAIVRALEVPPFSHRWRGIDRSTLYELINSGEIETVNRTVDLHSLSVLEETGGRLDSTLAGSQLIDFQHENLKIAKHNNLIITHLRCAIISAAARARRHQ